MIRFLCASGRSSRHLALGCLLLVIWGGLHGTYATLAAAGDSNGREKVKAGIALYQSGQYGAAAETFAQAEQDLPEEPRIALDRAAVPARQARANRRSSGSERQPPRPSRKLRPLPTIIWPAWRLTRLERREDRSLKRPRPPREKGVYGCSTRLKARIGRAYNWTQTTPMRGTTWK